MYIPHTIFVMGHLDFSFLGSEVIAVCSFALIWREVDVFCRSKTHLPVEITTMDVCSSFVLLANFFSMLSSAGPLFWLDPRVLALFR